jgi:hypothetical protein
MINPCWTAGKRIEVFELKRKTTIFTSIVYCFRSARSKARIAVYLVSSSTLAMRSSFTMLRAFLRGKKSELIILSRRCTVQWPQQMSGARQTVDTQGQVWSTLSTHLVAKSSLFSCIKFSTSRPIPRENEDVCIRTLLPANASISCLDNDEKWRPRTPEASRHSRNLIS